MCAIYYIIIITDAPLVTTAHIGIQFFPLGRTLTLSCDYQGLPPHISTSWNHNGSAVMDSDLDITIISDAIHSVLTRTMIAGDGGGVYSCAATNTVGTGSANISVQIQRMLLLLNLIKYTM